MVQNIVGGAKDGVRETVKKQASLLWGARLPAATCRGHCEVDITGRVRAHATGGKYGPRNSALVVGCTHSDNHPARSDLALSELIGEREW
jgi:hypothetical protein